MGENLGTILKEEMAQQPKRKVYLRLISIFEGDIEVATKQFRKSFMFYLKDIDGNEYIAPVTCAPNLEDSVRKYLSKIVPLYLAEDNIQTEGSEIVNIQNMNQRNLQ